MEDMEGRGNFALLIMTQFTIYILTVPSLSFGSLLISSYPGEREEYKTTLADLKDYLEAQQNDVKELKQQLVEKPELGMMIPSFL